MQLPKSTTVKTLSNGVRYIILPTSRTATETSIRVRIGSGVAQELQDMPTARIAALDSVSETQWHATTGFQQTIFSLDLDSADSGVIESQLVTLLSGMKQTHSIDEDSFQSSVNSALTDIQQVLNQQHLESLSMNHSIAPFDLTSMQATPIEAVGSFKNTHYAPDNMTIIVAGGVDTRALTKAITRNFSNLQHKTSIISEFTPALEMAYHIESPDSVAVSALTEFQDESDSKLQRKEVLKKTLANKMLEQRIQAAMNEQNLAGKVFVDSQMLFDHKLLSQVRIEELSETEKTLAHDIVDTEIKRALASGFKQAEYEMVVSQLRKQLEQQTRSGNRVNYTKDQADRLVSAVNNGMVYTAPSYDLDLLNFHVAHLNEFDISKDFEQVWSTANSVTL
ncbi:insulinase family protein [Vibrio sp. RE86]|nr:insulinase family protein [Vibrio sp. RE86]